MIGIWSWFFDHWFLKVTCILVLGHSPAEFVFYISLHSFMCFSLPSLGAIKGVIVSNTTKGEDKLEESEGGSVDFVVEIGVDIF